MACHGSFPSSHIENHPSLKSGWYMDPEKPKSAKTCRGDVSDSPTFMFSVPDSMTFATDRRVSYMVGSSRKPPLVYDVLNMWTFYHIKIIACGG